MFDIPNTEVFEIKNETDPGSPYFEDVECFCPACGWQDRTDQEFCPECGYKLEVV